jgi:branched-subunit amino acid transport protein
VSELDIWIVIGIAAAIVFFQRVAFLLLPPSWSPRGGLLRALAFAPLAALIAICVPEMFALALQVPLEPWHWFGDGRLLAALVLALAVWRGLNGMWSLLLAGGVLWLF